MPNGPAMRMLLIATMFFGCTTLAAAQTPAAIVESVKGHVTGAEFMDYVTAGQVIKLGTDGAIVLAYLSSCVRETISGGVVVVGADESKVSLADVTREKILCDGARTQVTNAAAQGGGMAFRNPQHQPAPTVQLTIYGLSPLFEVTEPGTLVVERIDKPGERYETKLSTGSLTKAKFHDLAAANTQLKRGGIYAATLGSHKIVFKVDELAEDSGPLLGRLVRL